MPVSTVNIAFDKQLLKEIDGLAKKEHRSRSELVREAVRSYIESKDRWQKLFHSYDAAKGDFTLSENEVVEEIRKSRRERKHIVQA